VKLVFEGEPKSTQHIYRSACRGRFPTTYMTREGKLIKEGYRWEARAQWRQRALKGELYVAVEFYFATRRRRDLDNQNKLILDALSGIVYEDDSQVAELTLRRRFDKDNPRIEISIWPV
jgi:crossover junction endodeoxyribonuclease RusA